MKADHFRTDAAKQIVKELDAIAATEGQRADVFANWLSVVVSCLAAETLEDDYLAAIKRYAESNRKTKHLDHLAKATAILFQHGADDDVLGDAFEGGISWGEHGQFFTPLPICKMMAQLTGQGEVGAGRQMHDPACGSGRMLIASAEAAGPLAMARLYTGMDLDDRCAKMAAINLALRGLCGWIVCGNSLSLELRTGYMVGPFHGANREGWIRKVDPKLLLLQRDDRPAALPEVTPSEPMPAVAGQPTTPAERKPVQADLFAGLE
jgi:hypothetical protein